MKALISLIVFCLVTPAFASMPDGEEHQIKTSVKKSESVIVVEDTGKTEVVKRKVFPKSTHFKKERETVYEEIVKIYKVTKVLKADSGVKVGELIKVWQQPYYTENMLKRIHEKGEYLAPSMEMINPKYTTDEMSKIIFLTKVGTRYQETPDSTAEGLTGLSEIQQLIEEKAEEQAVKAMKQ
jgi:hypothetical protein